MVADRPTPSAAGCAPGDDVAAALLRRARLVVGDGDPAHAGLLLDGWPLVRVDVGGGRVAVNDLRSAAMYAHGVEVGTLPADAELRLGAVGEELYLLVGEEASVFVVPEAGRGAHAEVAVVASASGQLLLERAVRYRQVPASPSCAPARR
ncbi:MAG TPA: hypothetical protein VFJ85_08545 [Acidimicrobiales bacterium]|nr:hypothetical protein [Acidimicrobiales bacterium]